MARKQAGDAPAKTPAPTPRSPEPSPALGALKSSASKTYCLIFTFPQGKLTSIRFKTKEAMIATLQGLKWVHLKSIYIDGTKQDALTRNVLWLAAQPNDQISGRSPRCRQKP
jgi:hypothetical protein